MGHHFSSSLACDGLIYLFFVGQSSSMVMREQPQTMMKQEALRKKPPEYRNAAADAYLTASEIFGMRSNLLKKRGRLDL